MKNEFRTLTENELQSISGGDYGQEIGPAPTWPPTDPVWDLGDPNPPGPDPSWFFFDFSRFFLNPVTPTPAKPGKP